MKKILAPAIAAVALVGIAIAASSMTAPKANIDASAKPAVTTTVSKEDCGSCPKAMAASKEDCGTCPEAAAMAAAKKEKDGCCPGDKPSADVVSL